MYTYHCKYEESSNPRCMEELDIIPRYGAWRSAAQDEHPAEQHKNNITDVAVVVAWKEQTTMKNNEE